MTSTFIPAAEANAGLARICFLGAPGVGKTRLCGTFPHPLFADLENGAATAVKGGANRVVISTDRDTVKNTGLLLDALVASPFDGVNIKYTPAQGAEPILVGTVIIDSIDAIQQSVKMFSILKGREAMKTSDWDTLLNMTLPLVLKWNALPVHVCVVSHAKETMGKKDELGSVGFSVQGALRTQMPHWFGCILHMVAGSDGTRHLITQPMVSSGMRYTAKDRHQRLTPFLAENKKFIKVEVDSDGYPTDEIAKALCRTA